jgi:2-haloacid dehalogenase
VENLKARGSKTAILSNGSPAMLDAAVTASGIAGLFDAVLSVDAVRVYKPRPEVYALVTARFAIKPEDTVFVSSNRWDVMGAAAFGFRPLWVNRAKMPEEYADQPPLRVIADLSALASV